MNNVINKKNILGQALPLALVLMAAVAATVFYMFNTGQVVQEKMRLTNTADAVAYSAGVYEARVLNYDAYTNRAMIANQIAIGHAVGLGSWLKYSATMAENIGDYAQYVPVIGWYVEAILEYYKELTLAALMGFQVAAVMPNDEAIQRLMASQYAVHASVGDGRMQVMDAVAKKNDPDARVDLLETDFLGFTQPYLGNGRERMRETVERTRRRDDFLMSRDWTAKIGPGCSGGFGWELSFKNVGGTGLIGFDGWRSVDTLSAHFEIGDDGECEDEEEAVGYGSSFSNEDLDNQYDAYKRSEITNPESHKKAMSSDEGWAWDSSPPSITGGAIPNHWGLSRMALNSQDPRTQIAIRVSKSASRQRYSGGTSVVKPSGKLALYQGQHAKAQSASVSRAEVFFDRPDGANRLGSLFNPYWQVHLVPVTDKDRD